MLQMKIDDFSNLIYENIQDMPLIIQKVMTEIYQLFSSGCEILQNQFEPTIINNLHSIVLVLVVTLVVFIVALLSVCLFRNKGNSKLNKRSVSDRAKTGKQKACNGISNGINLTLIKAVNLAILAIVPENANKCLDLVMKFKLDVNLILPGYDLSVFLAACTSSNFYFIRRCLELGGNVHSRTTGGDSPLYLAAHMYMKHTRPYLIILDLLIDSGCYINFVNKRGYTILHYAAAKGDLELINFLLKRGALRNLSTTVGTPLTLAKERGHRDVVELLSRQYQQ